MWRAAAVAVAVSASAAAWRRLRRPWLRRPRLLRSRRRFPNWWMIYSGGCLQVADKRIRARAHTEAASMQARVRDARAAGSDADCGLPFARSFENLIQNLRAREARQNFPKICGPRRNLCSYLPSDHHITSPTRLAPSHHSIRSTLTKRAGEQARQEVAGWELART